MEFSGCIFLEENNDLGHDKIDSITIGMTDQIFGFYPFIESYDIATMEVNFNIFDGLVDFDESFRIVPRLAKSWNNPDKLTWRFNLRENVKFHNGYNFTSEDVKYSIDLVRSNDSSILKDLLIAVTDVIIIDNYTLDIQTNNSYPILLNKLVNIPIVSKKYHEETGGIWPIGTGCYKLKRYFPKDFIKLERFEDYWGGSPDIREIVFKLIEDDEKMKNALIEGEIDIAENILPKYVNDISNSQGLKVITISSPTVVYLSFDFRENNILKYQVKNPLSDIRVRKAIYHAINVYSIIENVKNGYAEPASQFLSPLIFGYNPNIERLDYNIELAENLLNESGYGNSFEITLDYPSKWYDDEAICEEVITQLSEIIDVKPNAMPVHEYFEKILSRNSSFYIIGWIPATGDGGEIFDYILRTVDEEKGIGTYNLGYYSNKKVDSIGENVSHIMDPEERLRLMQEGFLTAMNDIACIPLVVNVFNLGVIENIEWNPRSDMQIRVEDIKFT